MLITSSTRWVVLFPRYAIKLPSFKSWQSFLNGLRANLHESKTFRLAKRKATRFPFPLNLCPVLFSFPFGLLNVMPRCEHLTHDQWYEFLGDSTISQIISNYSGYAQIESKHDSFGWHYVKAKHFKYRRLVALDYGS